ncbi:MAG: GspH/FimT family protein, partial [Acidobacteria bacterium]|nr:GspH/FimT family protein [Acidobacteriota bacterium]
MRRSDSGLAFVDVIVATATLVVLSAMAVPVIGGVHDHARVRAAARYLSARLHVARLEALRRNTAVGLRFDDEAEGYGFRLYSDGDADGVLQRDIDAGIDRPIDELDRIDHHFGDITFRVNAAVPDVGGGDE